MKLLAALNDLFDDRNPNWHEHQRLFGELRMRRWRLGEFEYRDLTPEEASEHFADMAI